MIIKVYESDEFVSKVDNMQRLLYFESSFYEGRDRLDIETFTKECMTKVIVTDSFYTLELISNPWNIRKIVEEDYKEEVEEIEFEILYELKELIETMLLTDMKNFLTHLKKHLESMNIIGIISFMLSKMKMVILRIIGANPNNSVQH